MRSRNTHRLRHVEAAVVRGQTYLYYRRDGRRHPLPGPEGSGAFLAEYDRVHGSVERTASIGTSAVHDAVAAYYASADFHALAPASQRHYRWSLEYFRERAGAVAMVDIDDAWVDALRDALKADPIRWNGIRSRMSDVFARWRRSSGDQSMQNPWKEVRRLAVGDSDQNKPWPDDVLAGVLRSATGEFRALVVLLLLTAQRLGDVCAMPPDSYDAEKRTLTFAQGKTGARMVVHVPKFLVSTLSAMRGRHPGRLLCTPRGRPWATGNAQETLSVLRASLETGRYTLHGLRATGPVALIGLGFSAEEITRLTGHTDVAGLRPYLRGVDKHAANIPMQDALDDKFSSILEEASDGGNTKKYSGLTGKAAANAGIVGRASRPGAGPRGAKGIANTLPNAKKCEP